MLFPARILEEKGIIEFLYASLYLSKKFPKWKFLVAGSLDYKKNNSKLPIKKIVKKNTRIKFLGFRQNMHHLFNKSSIVCLPSYREGFPKSIIEGSASGCAIVTTNVPGCRESIVEKKNGLLCQVKNYIDLANKLEILISNKKLLEKYCHYSRLLAIKKYNVNFFINKNLTLYKF